MKKISVRGSQLKHRLNLFLAFAFLLIAVKASWPAEQSKQLRTGWGDFLHQIWNTADGLPQSTVYAILQTRDNFYWLGTDGGLARFDGQRFAYFTRENTPALTDNTITALYEDQDGDLWIGTYGGSLLRRHGQDFSLLFPGKKKISGMPIWTLASDGQGGILIGTIGAGLLCCHSGRTFFWQHNDELPDKCVMAITWDNSGGLWLGTQKGAVAFRHGSVVVPGQGNGLANDYVLSLLTDHNGNVWVGTAKGLTRISSSRSTSFSSKDGLPGNVVRSLAMDAEGNLWIGTDAGLAWRHNEKFFIFTAADGLSDNALLSLFQDKEGQVWLGTAGGGINLIKKNSFANYLYGETFPASRALCLYAEESGALWAGTMNEGVWRLSQGKWQKEKTGWLPTWAQVRVLLRDRQKRFWIGTAGAGLWRSANSNPDSLLWLAQCPEKSISTLAEDSQGNMWIGTEKGILFRAERDKFVTVTLPANWQAGRIRILAGDSTGRIWLAGGEGELAYYDGSAWQSLGMANDVRRNALYAWHEERAGPIWLGSEKGLLRLWAGNIFNYTQGNALNCGPVYAVVADQKKSLWLGTASGLWQLQISHLHDFYAGRMNYLPLAHFDEADGLGSSAFIGAGMQTGCRTSDGRLWFITRRGPVALLAEGLGRHVEPVTPYIEQLAWDGNVVPFAAAITLPADRHNLEFLFSAVAPNSPRKVMFRYCLAGLDRQWIEAGNRRLATYSNVGPGRYRFLVMARYSNESWSGRTAEWHFLIKSPFYLRHWFFALVLAITTLLAGFLFLLHRRIHFTSPAKYRHSTLTAEAAQSHAKALAEMMAKEKPYLNSVLTVASLAELLAIPAKHLSQVIHERFAGNFNEYLNRFRIEEAKKKLADPKQGNAKLLKIACESGFNSKSVFHAAFKKHCGVSPAEYRRLAQTQSSQKKEGE